jgi:hypothetical protein
MDEDTRTGIIVTIVLVVSVLIMVAFRGCKDKEKSQHESIQAQATVEDIYAEGMLVPTATIIEEVEDTTHWVYYVGSMSNAGIWTTEKYDEENYDLDIDDKNGILKIVSEQLDSNGNAVTTRFITNYTLDERTEVITKK